jgi:hypothetical protein
MKQLSQLTEAAPVVRKLLERDVQKQCVDWARARGYWARKFSSQSQRSVPDYLFAKLVPNDRHDYPNGPLDRDPVNFATEFKRPGETSTKLQVDEQMAMRAAGWYVFECDNFEAFKNVVIQIEMNLSA